ncbi:TetR/AcrR family transcriptional regulator [Nocardia sp. BMG51109]|uniref:TetR/AcrR family transcriptional regulator n=1 Tax=Nocardia sp. BMG51109 TaxID=1056816 RepID=UPI000463A9FC|nr:TetR/AcrR family transcriptional regulator [Nocardia sp. BMG51109]
MGRRTRAEQRKFTRQRVLEAALAEFTEFGFRGATVDGIAERAGATRGAVYSNFPGKRALYLSTLAQVAECAPCPSPRAPGETPEAALRLFAATWAERLPRTSDYRCDATEQLRSPMLSIDLIPEIQSDQRIRRPFAQLIELDAILLGTALQALSPTPTRSPEPFVRIAESVLTVLYGATQLSLAAPGFVDPARLEGFCEQIAHLDPGADTPAPEPPIRPALHRVCETWPAPAGFDIVRATRCGLDGHRMVAVLGMHRVAAIQDALGPGPRPGAVTAVLVTDDRTGEFVPLARLALTDLSRSLRCAFPLSALPELQVVIDEDRTIASACGFDSVDNDFEAALTVGDGRITARAQGPGACLAVAAAVIASYP